MSKSVYYIDRGSKKKEREKIYGEGALYFLYGKGLFSSWLAPFLRALIGKLPIFSIVYGYLQRRAKSAKKVKRFIKEFGVDPSEFIKPVESFASFDDFFIRKLKKGARPLAEGERRAILPADGRYLAFPDWEKAEGVFVKGKKFSIPKLLEDLSLAKKYEEGAVVFARLCPTDYHRFHFPCSGIAFEPKKYKGDLYSVNPLALRKNIEILTQNKRYITHFKTDHFGEVLLIEIGATNVGTVHQSYHFGKRVEKGEEKGYFSFGGSALVLLFETKTILLDQDLVENTKKGLETKALFGASLGVAVR